MGSDNPGLGNDRSPKDAQSGSQALIYVTGVRVGREFSRPGHSLVLPAGTNHVEIEFEAVDISAPEKIHLQYRLDGAHPNCLMHRGQFALSIKAFRPGFTHFT